MRIRQRPGWGSSLIVLRFCQFRPAQKAQTLSMKGTSPKEDPPKQKQLALTIVRTARANNPLVLLEDEQEERRKGLSEEFAQNSFFFGWVASLGAAVFGCHKWHPICRKNFQCL